MEEKEYNILIIVEIIIVVIMLLITRQCEKTDKQCKLKQCGLTVNTCPIEICEV